MTDRYTGAILPLWDGITDRIPEYGGDRITGTNVIFFTMGNHLGLSQGDHNEGVTGLVR